MHPSVHCSTITSTRKQFKCPSTGKGKEDMVSIYNKILFSHEKKMLFTATWIKLETIILGEVRHRKTNVI